MDDNLALFNQINSLSYWLLRESDYKGSITFDANDDSYFITIKKGIESIYKHHIEDFSRKDPRLLKFELSSIVNHLLQIKRSVHFDEQQPA
ncbi:hypothetical protein [uncultured Psychroserpens sp.]|uniref:hypothetical protein n=1 Tax=uncultured Psychroserpens sp. TaxID=255436 RepID=UPI00262D18BB|nr:hypothetical protein [uncultured Psychroserpens sp.]